MALKPGQAKCIETLDRSIVVAAGAGSGKTFTLTKRIVHAIECGAVDGIDRICAITFTKAAANEFYARFQKRLSERMREPSEGYAESPAKLPARRN